MPTSLSPYIGFKDNAREAMEFYKTIFGGDVEFHTFEEFHAAQDPADNAKIMHSMIRTSNGLVFMAADTPTGMQAANESNISMSLSGDNEAELSEYFQKLSEGGMTIMPLEKAGWGDMFGMCTDKFGVRWMVNISAKKQ